MPEEKQKLVKDLFPELEPAEVDQAEDNLREFLGTSLDIFLQSNNKEVVETNQPSQITFPADQQASEESIKKVDNHDDTSKGLKINS